MGIQFSVLSVANGVDFDDSVQGIILLNAILKEWLRVTQIHSQSNQTLATTTFLGVRDTIMAEFECSTCLLTLAAHCISAVKRKGKSPTYSEQTSSKSAPPKASSDAPSGTPKRRPGEVGKVKKRRCMLL